MDNFKNLQDSWKNQDSSNLPDMEAIKLNVNKLRNQLVRRNVMAIVALAVTVAVMFLILFGIDFDFITTKIALIGVILTVSGAIIFLIKLNNQMYKADKLLDSSKTYLQELKKFKTDQTTLQQKGMLLYFSLIGIFLALYFYEIYHMNKWIGISAYVFAGLWMLFVWFVIRPRKIAKDNQRINEMINEVERIEGQL